MMWDPSINGKVQQFYGHSLEVGEVFMQLPRDLCRELEKQLALAADRASDNHVVYEVTYDSLTGEPEVTYIWFTNFEVYFGRRIIGL